MSLPTRQKVQTLQVALHAKAKHSPSYRFYCLYDKVYRADVLSEAYERCRKNGGAAGVDGQTFEGSEAYGVKEWLGELARAYRAVDRHTASRLRQWLRRKYQVQGRGFARFPDAYLYQRLNLVRLTNRRRNFAWANA